MKKAGSADERPTCFVSYAWEGEVHEAWVRMLAEQLVDNGVITLLDQWDLRPGMDFLRYMETSVRDSDFVLLVCTPGFTAKANQRSGGVGYEGSIITGELFLGAPETKFVPLIRMGEPANALPSYLRSRVFVDFTEDERFSRRLEDLLRHIFDAPRFSRPQLGAPPAFLFTARQELDAVERPRVGEEGRRGAGSTDVGGTAAPRSSRGYRPSSRYDQSVFINCRSDPESRPIRDAIVYTCIDCGFVPRSAIEIEEPRVEKIAGMIADCRYGIHDISPAPPESSDFAWRENVPFELGMFIGAQQLGRRGDRRKAVLVLDRELYRYRQTLSDISGLDIQAHGGDAARVVRAVRNWLATIAAPQVVPGGAVIHQRLVEFQHALPGICAALHLDPAELAFLELVTLMQTWVSR
jgi:hypothetical protein